MPRSRSAPLIFAAALCLTSAVAWAELPFKRTEERQPCSHFSKERQPFFGDLHVHTSFSFDSYLSSQRNDPGAAYRYARGEPIVLSDADANQAITAQIQRPLDFTAVTDLA